MNLQAHALAVCSWSLQPADMPDLVQMVRQLGLSHLQLALAPLLALDEEQRRLELGHLRTSGLTVTAGMIAFPREDYSSIARIRITGGFAPDDSWPLRRQLTLQAGKLAQDLGLAILTTHVGFIPQSNHADYPKLLGRVADLAAVLAESGITLAMETGQETASELLQFLNDLPTRNVAVNFDPANMILYGVGDPIDAIHTLDRHIRHVHVKDAIASAKPGLDWGRPAPVGCGQVDFDQFLLALHEVGYAGPLAIEQESGKRRLDDLRAAIETLRKFAG
ncbi:MAG: sugar phosphate isomerase/epimerase family protein [Tepidisphaeraceae bacterium]|jgi:sugar phosphate isomerase/epimerase